MAPRCTSRVELAGQPRLFGDGVGAPDERAAGGIEGGDAAAERAALVGRISRRRPLRRGHRHVQTPIVVARRARDGQARVRIDARLPQLLAAARVERVGVAVEVGDPQARPRIAVAAAPGFEHRTRAYLRFCREAPAHAAGVEIERIDGAVLAADIQRAAADGRLRAGAGGAGKRERPFDREPRHVPLTQARGARVDVARVLGCHAPASKRGRPRGVELGAGAAALRRAQLRIGRRDRAAEEVGQRTTLGWRQRRCLRLHDARLHRAQDRCCAQHLELDRVRRARHATFVAGGAVILVQRGGVTLGGGVGDGRQNSAAQQQQRDAC